MVRLGITKRSPILKSSNQRCCGNMRWRAGSHSAMAWCPESEVRIVVQRPLERTSDSKGHQVSLNLAYFWFRSSLGELASTMKRTSEAPHQSLLTSVPSVSQGGPCGNPPMPSSPWIDATPPLMVRRRRRQVDAGVVHLPRYRLPGMRCPVTMTLLAKISTAADDRSARLAGIGLMLLSVSLFSFGDALGKFIVATYSVGQLLWLRACAALILLSPMIWRNRSQFFQLERPWLQLLRVTLSTLEVAAFFLATVYLPLADVVTYYLACPIFVTALSGIVLGERIGWRRWTAILFG